MLDQRFDFDFGFGHIRTKIPSSHKPSALAKWGEVLESVELIELLRMHGMHGWKWRDAEVSGHTFDHKSHLQPNFRLQPKWAKVLESDEIDRTVTNAR